MALTVADVSASVVTNDEYVALVSNSESASDDESESFEERNERQLRVYLESIGWILGKWLGSGANVEAHEIHRISGSAPGFPDVAVIITAWDHDEYDNVMDIEPIWEAQKSGELSTDHVARIYDMGTYVEFKHYAILEKIDNTLSDLETIRMREFDSNGEPKTDNEARREAFYYKLMMDHAIIAARLRVAGWEQSDTAYRNMGYIGNRLVYIDLDSIVRVPEVKHDERFDAWPGFPRNETPAYLRAVKRYLADTDISFDEFYAKHVVHRRLSADAVVIAKSSDDKDVVAVLNSESASDDELEVSATGVSDDESESFEERSERLDTALRVYLESIGWTLGDYLGQGTFNEAYEVYRIPGSAPGFPDVAAVLRTHDEDAEEDVSDIDEVWKAQKSGELPTEYVVRIYDMGAYTDGENYAILEKIDDTLPDHIEEQTRIIGLAHHYDGVSDEDTEVAYEKFYYKLMMDIYTLGMRLRASGWYQQDSHLGNMGYIGDRLVYIDLESIMGVAEEDRYTVTPVRDMILERIGWFEDEPPAYKKALARYNAEITSMNDTALVQSTKELNSAGGRARRRGSHSRTSAKYATSAQPPISESEGEIGTTKELDNAGGQVQPFLSDTRLHLDVNEEILMAVEPIDMSSWMFTQSKAREIATNANFIRRYMKRWSYQFDTAESIAMFIRSGSYYHIWLWYGTRYCSRNFVGFIGFDIDCEQPLINDALIFGIEQIRTRNEGRAQELQAEVAIQANVKKSKSRTLRSSTRSKQKKSVVTPEELRLQAQKLRDNDKALAIRALKMVIRDSELSYYDLIIAALGRQRTPTPSILRLIIDIGLSGYADHTGSPDPLHDVWMNKRNEIYNLLGIILASYVLLADYATLYDMTDMLAEGGLIHLSPDDTSNYDVVGIRTPMEVEWEHFTQLVDGERWGPISPATTRRIYRHYLSLLRLFTTYPDEITREMYETIVDHPDIFKYVSKTISIHNLPTYLQRSYKLNRQGYKIPLFERHPHLIPEETDATLRVYKVIHRLVKYYAPMVNMPLWTAMKHAKVGKKYYERINDTKESYMEYKNIMLSIPSYHRREFAHNYMRIIPRDYPRLKGVLVNYRSAGYVSAIYRNSKQKTKHEKKRSMILARLTKFATRFKTEMTKESSTVRPYISAGTIYLDKVTKNIITDTAEQVTGRRRSTRTIVRSSEGMRESKTTKAATSKQAEIVRKTTTASKKGKKIKAATSKQAEIARKKSRAEQGKTTTASKKSTTIKMTTASKKSKTTKKATKRSKKAATSKQAEIVRKTTTASKKSKMTKSKQAEIVRKKSKAEQGTTTTASKKSKMTKKATKKSKTTKKSKKAATHSLFADRKQLTVAWRNRSLHYHYYEANDEERARLEAIAKLIKRPNITRVLNAIKAITDASKDTLQYITDVLHYPPESNLRLWEEIETIPKRSRNLRRAMFSDLYNNSNIRQRIYLLDSYKLFNPALGKPIRKWLESNDLIAELVEAGYVL